MAQVSKCHFVYQQCPLVAQILNDCLQPRDIENKRNFARDGLVRGLRSRWSVLPWDWDFCLFLSFSFSTWPHGEWLSHALLLSCVASPQAPNKGAKKSCTETSNTETDRQKPCLDGLCVIPKWEGRLTWSSAVHAEVLLSEMKALVRIFHNPFLCKDTKNVFQNKASKER